ncbi:MAG: hypothetical protein AB7D39_12300 [Pseudodesulfovibrio sp.]|uniref:hypothetical protein n=1 Tax=Pseudodesulfovibrio sp. TaxID=2035812 RepID=UPI003D0C5F9B
MKKTTTIALAFALTLLLSGLAFAMDMNHADMKAGDMTMQESMKVMKENLQLMHKDVAAMKAPAGRAEAMKAMDTHMTDMHHGMAGMETNAKKSGNQKMEASMKQMNKDMMTTMKGMGVMKKDADKGMELMMDGINKMEKTMSTMQGMM